MKILNGGLARFVHSAIMRRASINSALLMILGRAFSILIALGPPRRPSRRSSS